MKSETVEAQILHPVSIGARAAGSDATGAAIGTGWKRLSPGMFDVDGREVVDSPMNYQSQFPILMKQHSSLLHCHMLLLRAALKANFKNAEVKQADDVTTQKRRIFCSATNQSSSEIDAESEDVQPLSSEVA